MEKKYTPAWIKALFGIIGLGIAAALLILITSGNGKEVIEGQLRALREHRISQAYYEYTSKDFQRNTSLEAFREFLKLYPVLSDNKSIRFIDSTAKDQGSIVNGVIVANNLIEMEGEWLLVNEEGGMKIQSLKLTELLKEDQKASALNEVVEKVKDQLKAIRKNELVHAYYAFASKDFQHETTLQMFEEFLREHPILFNYQNLDLINSRIENSKAHVDLNLDSNDGTYRLEYILSRENGDWKLYSLRVVLPTQVAIKKTATNPDALIPPIKELLQLLSQKKIEQAYHSTSPEFQASTTFENFKTFIKSHPALSTREFVDVKTGQIENGTGKIQVNLHDENGLTVLDFVMGYDEGEWQIWGVEVRQRPPQDLVPITEKAPKPLARELHEIVQQWQQYLIHQDVYEAYHQLMSVKYKDKHSLEDFIKNMSAQPVMFDARSSYFNRVEDEGGKAKLRGSVTTLQGKTHPVRFDFEKDGREWKISHVTILPDYEPIAQAEIVLDRPVEVLPPPPPVIAMFIVGTEVNQDGLIKNPSVMLPSETNLIFFNAHIMNGVPKSQVTLSLTHTDSDTSTPQLATMVEEAGNTIVSFSFAAPKGGWPPGEYIAKVKTSSGQESIQSFTIMEK